MSAGGINRRQVLAAAAAVIAAPRLATGHDGKLHVRIKDLAFVPASINARPGEVIEWTNTDVIDHTATVKGGWEVLIPAGAKATHVVTKSDSVTYFCRFHPNMTASITVAV